LPAPKENNRSVSQSEKPNVINVRSKSGRSKQSDDGFGPS